MPVDDTHCQNCTTVIPKNAQYCPRCGQSVIDIRQPWLPLAQKMLGEVFDWDGRMITTLRNLILHPGRLTREFILGHRKRYTSPIRLYLVISVLFFYIFPLIIPESPTDTSASPAELATESYSRMMFVLLPVFALIVKLFYRGRYYLQHLVFSMHVFSAMFLVFAVMLSLESLADESNVWAGVQITVFAYMVGYCLTALKVAYDQTWIVSGLKLAGLVALFLPTLAAAMQLASRF